MRDQPRSTSRPSSLVCLVLAAMAAVLFSCSSSDEPSRSTTPSKASSRYPNAIVVLGHSGTTGADSDPSAPGADAPANSWATGDNPDVKSIYTRLLALNPAIRGHNTNLGVDGTSVDDLGNQVDNALALKPLPDLFIIQEVDNDMQCDGTDPANYPQFSKTLSALMKRITAKAPKATILLVSSPPGTVSNYGKVVAQLESAKAANVGDGPCDMFTPSGKAVPEHWRYQDKVIRSYHARLEALCKQFPHCRYDGGSLYTMVITADDLAPDGSHLSVAGLRKQAELEWRVLGLDS